MKYAHLLGLSLVAGVLAWACGAQAQGYPSKPITVISGGAPGGLSDLATRSFVEVVARNMNARMVVENKAGAGGLLAAQAIAQAAPDGYTIGGAGSGTYEITPHLTKTPIDMLNDFTFISMLFYSDNYVVAGADFPANSLKEIADLAKRKPGGLSFGSIGLGSPPHLMAGLFKLESGAPIEIVQYRGLAEAMADAAAGRLDFTSGGLINFGPFLQDKKVKLIALNAAARSSKFPNVPTFREQGFSDSLTEVWWGLVGPANMPKDIVDRLNAEFARAARDPELIRKLDTQDVQPRISTPDELKKLVTDNNARMGKVVKALDIKLQ